MSPAPAPARAGAPATAPARRRRRLVPAVGIAVVALLLSACGARIDTQLTVDRSGAGTRVMTLTLSEDQDSLQGGPEAVDASIRRHMPADVVEYSGITTGPGGELVATFTVPFEDTADYRSRMIALLAAGDQVWEQGNRFVVEQSRFVNGAEIEETFTSADLLTWMFNGLLEDGVVAESDASDMWELGDTTVVYDGISYGSSDRISFYELVDRGFDRISMETELVEDGYYRMLEYWLDSQAEYNAAAEQFDEFFDALSDQGAEVGIDTSGVGVRWLVGLWADDPEGMAALTDLALMSEETVFRVDRGVLPGDPATEQVRITEYAECSAICSTGFTLMEDRFRFLDPWTHWGGGSVIDEDEGVAYYSLMWFDDEPATLEMRHTHRLTDVAATLTLGFTGSATWQGEFTAAADTAEAVGDGFEQLLDPGDLGTFDVTADDAGAVTYTVTFTGGSLEDLAETMSGWSAASAVSMSTTDLGGTLVTERYALWARVTPGDALAAHLPAQSTTTVVLPFGRSFEEDGTFEGSRATFDGLGGSAVVRGTSFRGFVVYGNLLLLVVVAGVLGLVFRTRITAATARRREAAAAERQARAQAAQAQAYAQAQAAQHQAPPPPVGASVPVGAPLANEGAAPTVGAPVPVGAHLADEGAAPPPPAGPPVPMPPPPGAVAPPPGAPSSGDEADLL